MCHSNRPYEDHNGVCREDPEHRRPYFNWSPPGDAHCSQEYREAKAAAEARALALRDAPAGERCLGCPYWRGFCLYDDEDREGDWPEDAHCHDIREVSRPFWCPQCGEGRAVFLKIGPDLCRCYKCDHIWQTPNVDLTPLAEALAEVEDEMENDKAYLLAQLEKAAAFLGVSLDEYKMLPLYKNIVTGDGTLVTTGLREYVVEGHTDGMRAILDEC